MTNKAKAYKQHSVASSRHFFSPRPTKTLIKTVASSFDHRDDIHGDFSSQAPTTTAVNCKGRVISKIAGVWRTLQRMPFFSVDGDERDERREDDDEDANQAEIMTWRAGRVLFSMMGGKND